MCTRNHFGRVFRWIFLFCCFFHVCKPICCCFHFFLLVLSIHLHFLPLDVFLRARPILSNILSSNIKWTIKICINSMPDDFVSKVFWLFESPMHSAHTQHTPWEKNKFRPVERKREKEVCVKLNWVTPHAHFFSLSFSMLHFALFTCNEENALVTYRIPQFSTFSQSFNDFHFTQLVSLSFSLDAYSLELNVDVRTIEWQYRNSKRKIGNRNRLKQIFFHLFILVFVVDVLVAIVVVSSNHGELTLKYAYTASVQQSTRETVCNITLLVYT